MKFSNIKKIIQDLKYSVLHNYKLVILFMILFPVLILFNIKYWINYSGMYDLGLCLADCFSLITQPRFFTLAIIIGSTYLSQHLVKYDFMVNFVLLKKSRTKLWTDQLGKLGIISFSTALYLTVAIFGIGTVFSTGSINWSVENSFFYMLTENTIQIQLWQVMLAFFLTTFLTILAVDLFMLLFKWFFKNVLIGWMILIFVVLCDMSFFSLFFDKVSIMFPKWIMHQSIYVILLYPVVLLIIVNIIALLLAGKKDFFGENN